MRRKLGPLQSPVVSATVTRFSKQRRARSALKWGALSSVAMILVLADMYFCFFSLITSFNFLYVRFTEFLILLVLFLAVLYDIVLYLATTLGNPGIKLTNQQKKILGVDGKSGGFQTVASSVPFGTPVAPNVNNQATPIGTPLSGGVTPAHHYYSPTSASPLSLNNSFGHTPTRSSPAHSLGSPFSPGAKITSMSQLDQYLKTEEDREERMKRGSPDTVFSQSPGYWYGNQDGTPPLRKYHVATRCFSPSEGDRRRDSLLNVWNKVGIKKEKLSMATERCRKWLSQTIMVPVAKEIKSVNVSLKKLGSMDYTIGNASLSQLRDIARLKMHQYPSVGMLIQYLELSPKQEYLAKRIQELSEVGGIGNYSWDGGGAWKGRKWDTELPNDTQILIHLLCTYLDGHLPPTPQYPNGKTFTSQYLLKTPEKPEKAKANVCLYQTSLNPPHFKVLKKDSVIDIPTGRNNFFHSLIVFLYFVKKEEKGLLGQLDLELSGLNLLGIVEDL